MKNIFGIIALSIISTSVISCNNSKKETDSADVAQVETLNFSKFHKGNGMTDSTLVSLTIKGSEVEGKMLWLPDGKDSKFGILHGTKNGNGDINLSFENFQEGIKSADSMVVQITPNQMIIKDFWEASPETNKKTPAPYFKDTLQKSNTEVFPEVWQKRFKSIFDK